MTGLLQNRHVVVAALGITQILGWGCSYYFPAVLAMPAVRETGWPFEAVIAGVSAGLLTAGLASPLVGRLIAAYGGRPVLASSSLLFAAGMAGLGLSPNLVLYFAAWIVIGLAMAAGLYDAVFSALGRVYGTAARGAIASITLFGGFASTVCWPLSAWLEQRYGWRGTCFVYAALHLCLALPLQFMLPVRPVPRQDESAPPPDRPASKTGAPAVPGATVFILLAIVMTLTVSIGVIFLAHLVALLSVRGADAAQAIALGTLFGPAQVGARLIERMFGERYHPIWTMAAAALLMAAGLGILAAGFPVLAAVIALFAAGFGISWIARGTLPLVLFGAQRLPLMMGRLAFPSLIGQALAPTVGAFMITRLGIETTILALTAAAVLNVALVALLWQASGYRPRGR